MAMNLSNSSWIERKIRGYHLESLAELIKNFDWIQLDPYAKVVDYFLFDTKSSPMVVQSTIWLVPIGPIQTYYPLFLSGGLDPENIKTALKRNDPTYALDLNSKFEVEPGLKDIAY